MTFGVYLILMHPTVARRPCETCIAYMHNDRGAHFGEIVTRAGQPVPRPRGVKTPCRVCPKIPPGAEPRPANAVDLSESDLQSWEFYRECKAVNSFPADPLVRYAAAEFRAVEETVERARARQDQQRITLNVISAIKGG